MLADILLPHSPLKEAPKLIGYGYKLTMRGIQMTSITLKKSITTNKIIKTSVRCRTCKTAFWTIKTRAPYYCSKKCHKPIIKFCKYCGQEFKIQNNQKNSRLYCSDACSNRYNRNMPILMERECNYCGREFKPSNNRHIYCSRRCSVYSRKLQRRLEAHYAGG